MKSRVRYKLYLLLVVLSKTVLLNSQNIKSSVDRNSIVIGEQIKLKLTIESLNQEQFGIAEWPGLPDIFNHFEVTERSKVDSLVLNGLHYYRQTLTITSFDSGQWKIPALVASFKDKKSDSLVIRSSSLITIDVNPADISGIKGYHDVKDIIITTSESEINYKLIITGSVFLVMFLIAWWIIRKRKKRNLIVKDETEITNPLEWALAQLQILRENQRTTQPATKENYHRLYHICRKFFFLRINNDVVHFTTREWGVFLDTMGIDKELKDSFFRLLQKADDKRFAKNSPAEEFESALMTTEEIIKKLDGLTN